MQLIIELPSREEQIDMNRRRLEELQGDSTLADVSLRIETNAHGQILMTPPSAGEHSYRQSSIFFAMERLLKGQVLAECPISTMDGVRAAVVGWYSSQRFSQVRSQPAFEIAPEICVEVISPGNTKSGRMLKKQLYFEAGAEEVWFCQLDGQMEFYTAAEPAVPTTSSTSCPDFPSPAS